ncbi:MAG: acyltransferase, partial [Alistipes sp.]|nr:acyltransferase [Alistipes sp.]
SFYTQAMPGVVHVTPVIEVAWAFCTINCVVATFGAFLLFSCIEQKEAPAIITDASKLSFAMYLMHLLWLGFWILVFKEGRFGEQFALPSVAAIPVIAVATFICCYVTSKLISYIPGSKWIIG